jgi:hypothetical protein
VLDGNKKMKEVSKELWISRKRFKELEEKCNKLEKMKEDIDRVKRIMKYAKSSELTYVDQKCYVYVYDTFCSKNPYYVYLNNNEYEISVPCGQKIYDVQKTKSDNTIIVMCIQNTTDNDPVYYNYLVDLKSDNKVCITLDEVNRLKI